MRYYLDTNILAFLVSENRNEISSEVRMIVGDYSNTLITSTVCVMELIQLFQNGRLTPAKGVHLPKVTSVLEWFDYNNIAIEQVDRHHLQKLSELPYYQDHRDPNDRLIIAQAIADRVTLVSSDTKMERYRRHGLMFVFNKR